jgi:hypothetical protein
VKCVNIEASKTHTISPIVIKEDGCGALRRLPEPGWIDDELLSEKKSPKVMVTTETLIDRSFELWAPPPTFLLSRLAICRKVS